MLRKTFECVAGLELNDQQWDQASLRVQQSGTGLSRAADLSETLHTWLPGTVRLMIVLP